MLNGKAEILILPDVPVGVVTTCVCPVLIETRLIIRPTAIVSNVFLNTGIVIFIT